MKRQPAVLCLAFLTFALLVLEALSFTGCSRGTTQAPVLHIEELNEAGRVIGYEEGQASGSLLPTQFPHATLKSFTDKLSGYEAVKQGKIDAFAYDSRQLKRALEGGLSGVKILGSFGETVAIGVGISPVSRIPALEERINAFLAELRSDGTLADIMQRWMESKDAVMPEIPVAQNPVMHLCVGTTGIVPPYSYFKGTELTGMDIELAKRFAFYLNADCEIKVYDYGSIVAASLSGDIDCIFANLNATPERREKIAFSMPIYTEQNALLVRDEGGESGGAAKARTSAATSSVPASAPADGSSALRLKYNAVADMQADKKLVLGMQTGFVFVDKKTREIFPNAKIEYYNTTPDMAYLVSTGKLDGFVNDEPVIRYCALAYPNLSYIHCGFEPMDIVVCFPKTDRGAALRDEFNIFLGRLKKTGELKKLDELWLGSDEAHKIVQFPKARDGKPTFKVGTTAETAPFEYIKDGNIVGYEMDLLARFCAQNGYGLTVQNVPFDAVILGLESGMFDFVASCLSDTPAHKEAANLSDAIYSSECVMAVQVLDGTGRAGADGEGAPAGFAEASAPALSDYNTKTTRIGLQVGAYDEPSLQFFTNAQFSYYNSIPDLLQALTMGKIDGFIMADAYVRYLKNEEPRLTMLKLSVPELLLAYAFSDTFTKTEKGSLVKSQLNAFITDLRERGTLSELEALWFSIEEDKKLVSIPSDGKNGTLRLATEALNIPFDYWKDNNIAGYEIDLLSRFCTEYGYSLEISDMRFDALLPALSNGQCDIACGCFAISNERGEAVQFSEPIYYSPICLSVLTGGTESAARTPALSGKKAGVLSSLASSFEKTFVREGRWRLIVHGIGITVLISVLSALFGTVLGFALCGLRLSKNRLLDTLALVYIRIMQGLPMVVLLMILFYIVFARTGLPGIWVSVIGFGMNFGAYVSEMIRTGILAVDRGQTEAALALGYPPKRAFLKMVLPQAARHFLPVYQGEFISLVKMTSVVGYIAIQDLTKASDIIRSRTYEAFFPLVTTAVIYFAIAWLLTRVLTALQTRLDPKRRRARQKLLHESEKQEKSE